VSNGSSKNDITMDTLRTRGPSKEYDEGYARIFGTKAPQAECAPPPKQEALGEPFQTVLDENRWNLYAEEKPKGMKGCGKCDDDPAECAWHQQCQAECAPREAQPIYLVSSEGRFWQIVSEPVWVNWQADYRNVLYTAAREVQPVNIEKEDDSEIACISCGLTLGESRLITSHAERKGRGYITKDAVERAKRVMAAVDTYHERPDGGNRHALRSILMDEFEELLAAPTPERADADTAGVNSDSFEKWWDMERARIQADRPIDKSIAHRGWCAAFAAGASHERADAGKDAALTDKTIILVAEKFGFPLNMNTVNFARAILAADKEPPDERAEPRALTDADVVRALETWLDAPQGITLAERMRRAIEQAVKERT
jgi:hypothetical protein